MWNRRTLLEIARREREPRSHLGDMLLQLSDRGPDSAGVAIYRDPASGSSKVSLFSPDPAQDWGGVRDALAEAFGAGEPEPRGSTR